MENKLHRCFIAVKFEPEVEVEIKRVQNELWKYGFVGKLTEEENLHLTLKFLGEISIERLEEVKLKLKGVDFEDVECVLGDAGIFNFRGNPKIVWIKINGRGVFHLQRKIDIALSEVGFALEERFMSHLTIARVKYVKNKSGLKKYVSGLGVRKKKFKIKGFELFESVLKEMGPDYSLIGKYGFC
jgi:RNA 2',3'-cyclic 3'-phosphodiesterase